MIEGQSARKGGRGGEHQKGSIRILFCVSSKGSTRERNTARKEKLLQKEEKCGFSSLYDGIMQHHRMQLLIEYLNFVMAKIPQANSVVCFHMYVAV